MQLLVDVRDDFIPEFVKFAKNNNIQITENNQELTSEQKLAIDPYFFERQKHLHQLVDDVNSGKAELLSQQEYDAKMDRFLGSL
jgi:ribosome assembly protein YihI (activator of Der GTPase)